MLSGGTANASLTVSTPHSLKRQKLLKHAQVVHGAVSSSISAPCRLPLQRPRHYAQCTRSSASLRANRRPDKRKSVYNAAPQTARPCSSRFLFSAFRCSCSLHLHRVAGGYLGSCNGRRREGYRGLMSPATYATAQGKVKGSAMYAIRHHTKVSAMVIFGCTYMLTVCISPWASMKGAKH
jgi:hypothetical protein